MNESQSWSFKQMAAAATIALTIAGGVWGVAIEPLHAEVSDHAMELREIRQDVTELRIKQERNTTSLMYLDKSLDRLNDMLDRMDARDY